MNSVKNKVSNVDGLKENVNANVNIKEAVTCKKTTGIFM